MDTNLKALEQQARLLDPDAAARAQVMQQVIDYSQRFLEGLPGSRAYTLPPADSTFKQEAAITENGASIEHLLKLIETQVDSVGINVSSGRYLAYIPAGGLFYAAPGDYLAAVANRFVGVDFASPGAVQIENSLLRWMAAEMGYPDSSAGSLTSGGSLANLSAIVTARDAAGITGNNIPRSVVYTTGQVHHSLDKALHVAGLRGCIRRDVPVDAAHRMDAAALDALIMSDRQAGLNPWMVVGSAGTTNTGAVDPLTHLSEIAAAHRLWLHVDGAYGGMFVLCPEGKTALRGIETADSIIADPHKTLFVPYGCGAVLVKDRQKLFAAFNADAEYLQDVYEGADLSPADLSPELTRHFRGMRLWLPLKLLGAAPFRAALSEKIHLARYFYAKMLHADGFEIGPAPDLSIVTYRYCPARGDADEFNQRLVQAIQHEGRIFVSSTRVDGKFVLRAAILSFRTHLDDIEVALETIQRNAKKIAEGF